MKNLKLFQDYIKESQDYAEDTILQTGTTLYHGSIEKFDLPLLPGGYDKVLWTAKEPIIAKMYIPESSGSVSTNLEYLANPRNKSDVEGILTELGIIYTDVIYDQHNKITSFKLPDIYRKIADEYEAASNAAFETYKELKKVKDEYYKIEKDPTADDEIDRLLDLWGELEDRYETQTKLVPNVEKAKEKIIQDLLLSKYGYKADELGNLKIKKQNGKILPFNENATGTLYSIKLKRDMKMYDITKDRESDLTDIDYHKLDLFDQAKENGYDGVMIHDFAQSSSYGNMGHVSYGFFKNSIKDLDVSVIKNAKHPTQDEVNELFRK